MAEKKTMYGIFAAIFVVVCILAGVLVYFLVRSKNLTPWTPSDVQDKTGIAATYSWGTLRFYYSCLDKSHYRKSGSIDFKGDIDDVDIYNIQYYDQSIGQHYENIKLFTLVLPSKRSGRNYCIEARDYACNPGIYQCSYRGYY